MGRFAIAIYKPRPGHENQLLEVVRKHYPALKKEGLVTDRVPYVMRSTDGTILEIFEWLSAEATEKAHHNKKVRAIWEEFGAAAEFVPMASLPESKQLFANFDPVG